MAGIKSPKRKIPEKGESNNITETIIPEHPKTNWTLLEVKKDFSENKSSKVPCFSSRKETSSSFSRVSSQDNALSLWYYV